MCSGGLAPQWEVTMDCTSILMLEDPNVVTMGTQELRHMCRPLPHGGAGDAVR